MLDTFLNAPVILFLEEKVLFKKITPVVRKKNKADACLSYDIIEK